MQQAIDQQGVKDFVGKLLGIYTGCALTTLIDIGNQTGLFDAAAKNPAISQELAERAGLQERYVREWLGAMTTGGIFTYDPASWTYTLPLEHAVLLTGDTARNLAPMSQMLTVFGRNISQLVHCFREGGGIPYSAFWPAFTEAMGQAWRRIYDEHHVDHLACYGDEREEIFVYNQKALYIYTNTALWQRPRLYNHNYFPGRR